jgi:hypothetical protein
MSMTLSGICSGGVCANSSAATGNAILGCWSVIRQEDERRGHGHRRVPRSLLQERSRGNRSSLPAQKPGRRFRRPGSFLFRCRRGRDRALYHPHGISTEGWCAVTTAP